MRCSVYIFCPAVLSCSNLKLHQTVHLKNIFKQEEIMLQLPFNPGLTLIGFRTTRPRGPFLERPGILFWNRSLEKIRVCSDLKWSPFCFFSWKLYCIIFKSFETPFRNGKQNSLTGPIITGSFEKRAHGVFVRSPVSYAIPKKNPGSAPAKVSWVLVFLLISKLRKRCERFHKYVLKQDNVE